MLMLLHFTIISLKLDSYLHCVSERGVMALFAFRNHNPYIRHVVNKYTIRSIVCEASGNLVTRSLSHLVTRSLWFLGHSVTRSLSHSVTQSLGHSVTQSLGHSVIRSLFSTLILTDEQHQDLQVCFADNYYYYCYHYCWILL